ncbi:hypothetical protein [uncultured Herbaspirillum sp.]|uniref:hypothetical protein n=1 Tax=uncultured Herbaspirillum sp. TaxID=160236 RepID=UPI00258A7AE1|nr:hypothetical protein [uncultured Herbaspirillum sp.]
MPSTESSARQTPSFANSFALHAFGTAAQDQGGAEFAEHYARYARESAQLMQQISMKAPQLASVLEQLNEGSLPRKIDLAQPSTGTEPGARGAGLLQAIAGFCHRTLASVALLLQPKMFKNNKQA